MGGETGGLTSACTWRALYLKGNRSFVDILIRRPQVKRGRHADSRL